MKMIKLPYKSRVFRNYKPLKYLSDKEECRINNRFIYKYLPCFYLDSLFSKGLRFCKPDTWLDRGEKRFYEADYCSIKENFVRPVLFATCFTKNKNSEASWKVYNNYSIGPETADKRSIANDCRMVQLKINRAKLRRELANYCKTKKDSVLGIYEGEVCYIPTHTYLNCHLPGINGAKSLHNSLFGNDDFNLDNYLSVCLMKRKEFFEYEQELRYFLILNKEESRNEYFVKFDIRNIIEHIYLWNADSSDLISTKDCKCVADEYGISSELVEPADLYLYGSESRIHVMK